MKAPTPGPWHVEHGTPSGRRLVADLVEGEQHLTHYRIVHEGEHEGGGAEDAHMIAAAPDLYAAATLACGRIVEMSQSFKDDDKRWKVCAEVAAALGVALLKSEGR